LKIDQFREFWENIDSVIANVITSTVSSLTSWIPGALLGIIGKLPSLMIFLLITVISCFYFSSDIDRINQKTVSLLPMKIQKKVPDIKKRLFKRISGYVRAYFILLLLTFGELLVGFSVLRVPYPLILAVVISILDILPLLGVGTVLIPWALIEILFAKDYYTGIGLFIIYVIITVVRQITEPKIVAGSLGLPPLLTLIAMYAGLKLFGFFGIIIGPFLVLIVKSINEFWGGGSVDIKGDV
jgi:sporulation integral membrane protein YtvI